MIYDGWVYLAKSDTGHYKIGRSKNPFARIKHFDTIMPVKVEIVALIPCDDMATCEKYLHWYFDKKREAGEWFNLLDQDVQWLERCLYWRDGSLNYVTHEVGEEGQPLNYCCTEAIDNPRYLPELYDANLNKRVMFNAEIDESDGELFRRIFGLTKVEP